MDVAAANYTPYHIVLKSRHTIILVGSMVHKSSTSGSKKETAALILFGRGLRQTEVARESPGDLQMAANKFLKEIRIAAGRDNSEPHTSFLPANLIKLKNIMTIAHKNENEFNIALFATLRECLEDYILESNDDFFLIQNTCSNDYAVGFAREIRSSLDLFPKELRATVTDSTSNGMRLHSRPDHLVCLFCRNGASWKPLDCFAVVELRTNKTNCVDFPRNSETHQIQISEKPDEIIQDPLAQVILYNIGSVLLYHARRGKLVEKLPLAIIACKKLDEEETNEDARQKAEDQQETEAADANGEEKGMEEAVREDDQIPSAPATKNRKQPTQVSTDSGDDEYSLGEEEDDEDDADYDAEGEFEEEEEEEETAPKKQKMLERVQWVSGQLHVPEANGNRFFFSVKDFGRFGEPDSVEKALSLYLDTMLSGLKVAFEVLDDLVGNARPPPPVTASGRQLVLGNADLKQLELCASPMSAANPTKWARLIDQKWAEPWTISQGELFKGRLSSVRGILEEDEDALIFQSSEVVAPLELDVLVKVSSTAVHSVLVNPITNFLALTIISNARKRFTELNTTMNEIGSVLYGTIRMDVGLITIMADLSEAHYIALQPKAYKNDLLSLWNAFEELVKNVLLPLAEHVKVIHPDIRPGYDTTSNILLTVDGKGLKTMKLIDFESLVLFRDWEAPNAGRYMTQQDGKDAITFVWWQCVAMAYFWDKKISIRPVPGEKSKIRMLRDILLRKKKGPKWLEPLRGLAAGNVTAAQVKSTLTELANIFPNIGDRK